MGHIIPNFQTSNEFKKKSLNYDFGFFLQQVDTYVFKFLLHFQISLPKIQFSLQLNHKRLKFSKFYNHPKKRWKTLKLHEKDICSIVCKSLLVHYYKREKKIEFC